VCRIVKFGDIKELPKKAKLKMFELGMFLDSNLNVNLRNSTILTDTLTLRMQSGLTSEYVKRKRIKIIRSSRKR
jgi:hypothetical protein